MLPPLRKPGNMGTDDKQVEEVSIPIEQATVPFYGHELVAVRLADGRIAAVLRWICEGMGIGAKAQVQRIKRRAALRDDLVTVRVETTGGPQAMPALVLHGLPGWLYTVDETRVSEASRPAVILFQQRATDVLAEHFAKHQPQLAPPSSLVPAEPITQPARPERDAPPLEWAEYHEGMATYLRWQADIETWRGSIESRLESHEEVLRLVPEILERLGPETLTPEHQRTVQNAVKRLHDVAGYPYAGIYADLGEHFHVAKYDQIPEARWEGVAEWFQVRLAAAEMRRKPS
jgi:P22_AR N-terminal domain